MQVNGNGWEGKLVGEGKRPHDLFSANHASESESVLHFAAESLARSCTACKNLCTRCVLYDLDRPGLMIPTRTPLVHVYRDQVNVFYF